jgi:PhzF family phenazine biosynthesis protein
MRVPIYQIDAFTGHVFGGNPAAVCPLDGWLDDLTLQAIAAENNLSETAFLVRMGDGYELRWFTPLVEVPLCGHATLAAAYVVFQYLQPEWTAVTFRTQSGSLPVCQEGDLLTLDFPLLAPEECSPPPALAEALRVEPSEVLLSTFYLAVLESEEQVRSLAPDMELLKREIGKGVIVTARGREADFVSRFFAPSVGITEDPVTGSAHCTLAPYWAAKLGKRRLHALQVSRRGGELFCGLHGDRVLISGRAAPYLEGLIYVHPYSRYHPGSEVKRRTATKPRVKRGQRH